MHVVFSKLRKYRFLQLNSYFLLKLCFLASADPVSMSFNVYPCFWRCDAWSFSVCAGQREQSCSWCDHVTRMKLNVWTCEDNKWSCLLAWFFTPQCVCTMSVFPKLHVQPSNWKEGRFNRTTKTCGGNFHLNSWGFDSYWTVKNVPQERDRVQIYST